MKHLSAVILLLSLLAGVLPTTAQEAPITNLTSCVESFDPTMDYFPAKSTVDYATGLEIEYFSNYKLSAVLVLGQVRRKVLSMC